MLRAKQIEIGVSDGYGANDWKRDRMFNSVDLQNVRADDGVKVLDEGVWQIWIAEGARRESRAAARRMIAVNCLGIVVLAATALLWGDTSEYDLWIRFGVSLGAMMVLFQALQTLALLTALPYAASLNWLRLRNPTHEHALAAVANA